MTKKTSASFNRIILASQSPRRVAILRDAGFRVTPIPSNSSESFDENLTLKANLKAISEKKLKSVLNKLSTQQLKEKLLFSADTVVVAQGHVLGKPKNRADAQRMLRLLSGKTHSVMTAFSICHPSESRGKLYIIHTKVVTTRVTFRTVTDIEIERYIDSGEPFDKAGGYAIQGRARKFVKGLKGDFLNVVGLPLADFRNEVRKRGWKYAANSNRARASRGRREN